MWRGECGLLCSKGLGLFSSELLFKVNCLRSGPKSFFADESAWSAPLGVRVVVQEVSLDLQLALVALPNGEGSIVVHRHELFKLEEPDAQGD